MLKRHDRRESLGTLILISEPMVCPHCGTNKSRLTMFMQSQYVGLYKVEALKCMDCGGEMKVYRKWSKEEVGNVTNSEVKTWNAIVKALLNSELRGGE